MDFGKAFTYPFEDQNWAQKILIPALIGIIPIIGQIFLIGWMIAIIRRVISHDPNPLPELDFGKMLGDGFKGFVVGFVYALPIIILEAPIIIAPALVSSADENAAAGVITIISLVCGCLIFLYAVLLAFLLPAALTNEAAKDDMSAAFNFSQVFGLLKAAPAAWLFVFLGAILSSIIASLGLVACFIGMFFTYAYAMAVNGHLYGQAYLESTKNEGFARIY